MPSLFSIVDRMADLVILVISPIRSPSPQNYDYDYNSSKYQNTNTNTSYRRRQTRGPENPSFAVEGPQPRSPSPEDDDRSWKRTYQGKKIHWGGTTEIEEGSSKPTARGLKGYHKRRSDLRKRDYVYASGDGSGSSRGKRPARAPGPGAFPHSGRSDSPVEEEWSDTDTDSEASYDYEEQRYPAEWYSSSSRSPSPSSRHQDQDPNQNEDKPPKSKPLHHTHHPRKSILRSPTATDDEMLIKNLWAMVVCADSRLDYTYEFLSGVLIGDTVVDSMMEGGELLMSEEATKRAVRLRERQKEKERAVREDKWPMNIPVPQTRRQKQREQEKGRQREQQAEQPQRPTSRRDFERTNDFGTIEEEEEEE